MYGLTDYTLNTLFTLFQTYPGIREVILYGSRAMGTYKNGSDIDITLHTDDCFLHEDLLHLIRDLDDSNIPYTVDVSMYKALSNSDLKDHIQRVGKTLYKKEENKCEHHY
jgi:predicted nucleotidyltransferase